MFPAAARSNGNSFTVGGVGFRTQIPQIFTDARPAGPVMSRQEISSFPSESVSICEICVPIHGLGVRFQGTDDGLLLELLRERLSA